MNYTAAHLLLCLALAFLAQGGACRQKTETASAPVANVTPSPTPVSPASSPTAAATPVAAASASNALRERETPDAGSGSAMERASVQTGLWGGRGIKLQVTDAGASIEYDCAHGTIEQKIALNRDGHFDVGGTHVDETGGPARSGIVARDEDGSVRAGRATQNTKHPARYTGQVTGRTMTLSVTLDGLAGRALNTYRLTYGAAAQLKKCL